MVNLKKLSPRQILILLILALVILGGWLIINRNSPKETVNVNTYVPPASAPPGKSPVINSTRTVPDGATITLTGYITYASCGSGPGCDGFAFVDKDGKYWTINPPQTYFREYVNKPITIKATKVNTNTIDNVNIQ